MDIEWTINGYWHLLVLNFKTMTSECISWDVPSDVQIYSSSPILVVPLNPKVTVGLFNRQHSAFSTIQDQKTSNISSGVEDRSHRLNYLSTSGNFLHFYIQVCFLFGLIDISHYSIVHLAVYNRAKLYWFQLKLKFRGQTLSENLCQADSAPPEGK